jgi:hypothetical protein
MQCLLALSLHGWGAFEHNIPALFDRCLHAHLPLIAEALESGTTGSRRLPYPRKVALWIGEEVSTTPHLVSVQKGIGMEEAIRAEALKPNASPCLLTRYQQG